MRHDTGSIVEAASLAFVGLVQGAGITANFPNPDGTYPKASRDFIGQGVGNLVSGTFQGMPVGGSMSATSIVTTAGAQSRVAQMIAGLVMAVVVIAFGGLVGEIAMPALAGLLMVVGFRTVKPDDIVDWDTLSEATISSESVVDNDPSEPTDVPMGSGVLEPGTHSVSMAMKWDPHSISTNEEEISGSPSGTTMVSLSLSPM